MSTSTTVVNGALIYILAFSALLFFLIVFFMVYFVVRYRRSRNPVPGELKENVLLEAGWALAATLIVLTMFVYGLTGFSFLRNVPAGSINIKVHSRQWSWLFEYPNGKKSPDMVVPQGRNIRCELTSADVIHGFYVPAFRVQQDVVPGVTTLAWFNAVTPGVYWVLCAQYCGLKHSLMLAKLYVVPQDRYELWLKGGDIQLTGNAGRIKMAPGEDLIFERGCVSCHSLDGGAMSGPTFKGLFGSRVTVRTGGARREIAADEDYIRRSITNPAADIVEGFPNIMPSGRDVLSDKDIGMIIRYLRTLN